LKRTKENTSNVKEKNEFYFIFSLGVPSWLRKKIWPIMIGNKSSINENIFNFYLRQVEEVNFGEISQSIEERYETEKLEYIKNESEIDSNTIKTNNNLARKKKLEKKASLDKINFEKTVKKIEINFTITAEPLLNEIIIDIVNISLKFSEEIKEYTNIEIITLQKELFEIIRIFCMSRPDVTYTKQITYITFFIYLNSENFYMAFVNLTNLVVSTHLIKFFRNEEIFVI
jgi:hypothetical protein